jgi:adenylylsulfate kinase-like enzyme
VKQFTGKDSGFEEPTDGDPDVIIDTEAHGLEACVQQAADLLRS